MKTKIVGTFPLGILKMHYTEKKGQEYTFNMLALLTSEKCFSWCLMKLFLVPVGSIKQSEGSLNISWGPVSCENWPCLQSALYWSLGAIYTPNFLLKSDDTIPQGLIFWTREFVGKGNKERGSHGRRGHGILTLRIISVKTFLSTVDSWKIVTLMYPNSYFQAFSAHAYTY